MTAVFLPSAMAPMMDRMTNTTINALPLVQGRWTLDTNHSSIGFSIRHLGVSKVRGRFAEFDVALVVGESLESSSLHATVDLASIDTGNTDRDAHLRSADLLDVATRPTMTFRSTRIHGGGSDWVVEGDVTIGAITRPLTFDVEFGGIESFPGGPRHAGFEATGELRRKEFGIDIALPPGVSAAMLGDVVKFVLDVQLLEP
jgi:polyisoprenoid-binding protein YceI